MNFNLLKSLKTKHPIDKINKQSYVFLFDIDHTLYTRDKKMDYAEFNAWMVAYNKLVEKMCKKCVVNGEINKECGGYVESEKKCVDSKKIDKKCVDGNCVESEKIENKCCDSRCVESEYVDGKCVDSKKIENECIHNKCIQAENADKKDFIKQSTNVALNSNIEQSDSKNNINQSNQPITKQPTTSSSHNIINTNDLSNLNLSSNYNNYPITKQPTASSYNNTINTNNSSNLSSSSNPSNLIPSNDNTNPINTNIPSLKTLLTKNKCFGKDFFQYFNITMTEGETLRGPFNFSSFLSPNPNLIKALKKIEYPKYCFTNGTESRAKEILECLNLTTIFDGVICVDNDSKLDLAKPFDKSYEFVETYFNIQDTSKIIFFDDNLFNIESGQQRGWCCVHVDGDIVEKIEGVYELIKSEGER